jgi:hypothetical protein
MAKVLEKQAVSAAYAARREDSRSFHSCPSVEPRSAGIDPDIQVGYALYEPEREV